MRRPRLITSCGLLEATRLKNEGIIMDSLAVMRPRRCQQLQVVLRREQSSYTSEAVTARQLVGWCQCGKGSLRWPSVKPRVGK